MRGPVIGRVCACLQRSHVSVSAWRASHADGKRSNSGLFTGMMVEDPVHTLMSPVGWSFLSALNVLHVRRHRD